MENILIQGGNLAPKPPMPFFPDMPTHQPIVAPIPTTSTSQPLAITPIASTSSNELGELKDVMQALMQNIDKKLQDQEKKIEENLSMVQKISNKVVTFERKQAQNSGPF